MKFKIPFTFSDTEILKRRSKFFMRFVREKKGNISDCLKNSGEKIDGRQYFSICYRNFLFNLLILSVLFTSGSGITGYIIKIKIEHFFYYGMGLALVFSAFIFFVQLNYPKIYALNKSRNIEKNLVSSLQDILVQLNSGISLFKILINISESDYGEVSKEFKKITREINSGVSQIDAIENNLKISPSKYFKRVLWQISNGMRAGSDMSIVIDEEIKNLGKEQAIQIQSYGSKLNPMIMFYMIIAVILPALGMTFLVITSSMLNLQGGIVKALFIIILIFITFIQIMFLGIIKFRRPTLI
ncbi:MAG: type II secretion system F family protein [Candidatus Pacearchaeota archaeon]